MNRIDMSLEVLSSLVIERLAMWFRMSHTEHIDIGECILPYELVDLAEAIERDHATDDLLQLAPRLVKDDLPRLKRHIYRLLSSSSLTSSDLSTLSHSAFRSGSTAFYSFTSFSLLFY